MWYSNLGTLEPKVPLTQVGTYLGSRVRYSKYTSILMARYPSTRVGSSSKGSFPLHFWKAQLKLVSSSNITKAAGVTQRKGTG